MNYLTLVRSCTDTSSPEDAHTYSVVQHCVRNHTTLESPDWNPGESFGIQPVL
jgi:hypothetical protein